MEDYFRLRFRELREKQGLTQKEIGKRLGISDSAVNNYESGKRHPEYPMLVKIANFFGVSTDYLVGKENTWKYNLPEDIKEFVLNPDNRAYLELAPEIKESGVLPETIREFVIALIRDAKRRSGA